MAFVKAFENITGADQTDVSEKCDRVVELAALAAKAAPADLLTKWFGVGNHVGARKQLNAMNEYLTKKCTRLTFVGKPINHYVDGVTVDPGDYGQVIGNIRTTTANFQKSVAHVSSGLRIFIYSEYFKAGRYERMNTIYHELTHKILGTSDYKYGHGSCQKFAIKYPGTVLKNADNYGYFMADLDRRQSKQNDDVDLSGLPSLFD